MFDRGAFANALLTQPIFAGGRIVNGNKLAKLGIEAAELKLIMSRQEVELNVGRLYYQIVSLYERQRLLQTVRTMLDTLERDASVAVDAGVMGRNDLLRVRLKLNELSATDMQLSHGIELATRSMCQYIGLPYDSVSLVFDTLNLHHIPFPGLCVDPTTAAAHRSESRLLDLSVEAAGLKKRMAVGQTLPQLAVAIQRIGVRLAQYPRYRLVGVCPHHPQREHQSPTGRKQPSRPPTETRSPNHHGMEPDDRVVRPDSHSPAGSKRRFRQSD